MSQNALEDLIDMVNGVELPAGSSSKVAALDSRLIAALVAMGLSGTTVSLKTNGVANGSQTILNLKNGSSIAITDDGLGGITFAVSPSGADKQVQFNNAGALGAVGLNATATNMFLQQVSSQTPSFIQVLDSDLSLSNITTNNVTIAQHGFAPKLPNDATKFLDGTGAYTVPSGASGGLTLIQRQLITSNQTTVTFSGLDGNVDQFYFLNAFIKNTSGSTEDILLRPNGVTTNLWSRLTSAGFSGDTDAANNQLGNIISNEFISISMWYNAICNPNGQSYQRVYSAMSAGMIGGAGGINICGGTWNETTTNITSFDILSSIANGIGNGSVLCLYKYAQ